MTKRITVHLTIAYVPLPPEKRFAYNEAHRLLHELMLKAWLARKPEEGSHTGLPQPEEGTGLPQPESLPALGDAHAGAPRQEAGVTTPPILLEKPAGVTSSPLQAQTTTGEAG